MDKADSIKTNDGRDITRERETSNLLNEKCLRCTAKKKVAETKTFVRNIYSFVIVSIVLVLILVDTYLGYPAGGFFAGTICTLLVFFAYRIVVFLKSYKKCMNLFRCFDHVLIRANDGFESVGEREPNDSFDEKCLRCLAKERVDERIKFLKKLVIYTVGSIFFTMLGSTYVDNRLICFFDGVVFTMVVLLIYHLSVFLYSFLRFKIPFKRYY